MKYKIFGERNSGNNYLIKLCEKNLGIEIETNSYDWMHGIPTQKEGYKYIITVRNPESWALSMWEDPHSKEKPHDQFKKFIRKKWEGFQNPVYMWRKKYLYYLMLNDAIVVRFEDLLKDPEKEIKEIAEFLGVEMKSFEDIENEVRSGGTILEKKYDRREYYLTEQWRHRLAFSDSLFIKKTVGNTLLNMFDYE